MLKLFLLFLCIMPITLAYSHTASATPIPTVENTTATQGLMDIITILQNLTEDSTSTSPPVLAQTCPSEDINDDCQTGLPEAIHLLRELAMTTWYTDHMMMVLASILGKYVPSMPHLALWHSPATVTMQTIVESGGRYTPTAIRQGLAIFGTEREKGRLRNKTAHRYLVKMIQNCQDEISLRRQEELLHEYAKFERPGWLQNLEVEYEILSGECASNTTKNDLAFHLNDKAVFGGGYMKQHGRVDSH